MSKHFILISFLLLQSGCVSKAPIQNIVEKPPQVCKTLYGHVHQIPASICVVLDPVAKRASGSYFYYRHQTPITLEGSFNPTSSLVELDELGDKKNPRRITGKFSGIWNEKENEYSGEWTFNSKKVDFSFWDLSNTKFQFKRHSQKFRYCLEGVLHDRTLDWNEISNSDRPRLQSEINDLMKKYINISEIEEDSKKGTQVSDNNLNCPKLKKEEEEEEERGHDMCNVDTLYKTYYVNSFILGVSQFESGFCGGAHPFEEGKTSFVDLRTGRFLKSSDFFNKKGLDKIKENVEKTLKSECDQGVDSLWGYNPARKELEFGTYSFCSGRNGFNSVFPEVDVMEGVSPSGLNSDFYNPITGNLFDSISP